MAKEWKSSEVQVLRLYSGLGAVTVALLLDRSVTSVQMKARELRVSLAVTNDEADLSSAGARILQRVLESPGLTLCPMCGKRLANMRATGQCRTCHLDRLIELREEQALEATREKRMAQLRQEKRRRKVCDTCHREFFPRVGSSATTCQDCDGSR